MYVICIKVGIVTFLTKYMKSLLMFTRNSYSCNYLSDGFRF
jgi:hypothetical protein